MLSLLDSKNIFYMTSKRHAQRWKQKASRISGAGSQMFRPAGSIESTHANWLCARNTVFTKNWIFRLFAVHWLSVSLTPSPPGWPISRIHANFKPMNADNSLCCVRAPRTIVETAASYRSQSLMNGVPLTATRNQWTCVLCLDLYWLYIRGASQREKRTERGGRRMINIPSARRICCDVCLWCSNLVLPHWPIHSISKNKLHPAQQRAEHTIQSSDLRELPMCLVKSKSVNCHHNNYSNNNRLIWVNGLA